MQLTAYEHSVSSLARRLQQMQMKVRDWDGIVVEILPNKVQ